MGGRTKTSTLDAITRVLPSPCLRSKMGTALADSATLSGPLKEMRLMIILLSFLISLKCVTIHTNRGTQYFAEPTVDLAMVMVT
jgi:hypothetical protein